MEIPGRGVFKVKDVPVCRICKDILTKETTYQHASRKTRGRVCISCYNAKRRDKYQVNSTKTCYVSLRGRHYKGIRVTFANVEEKKKYQTDRRIQMIGCFPKTDTGSRNGQMVDRIVEVEIPGTNKIYRFYEKTLCTECSGDIRYDDHGNKVCEDCGWIDGEQVLDNELFTHRDAHVL